MPRVISEPTITIPAADGSDSEIVIAAKFAVCPKCRGRGAHVNPAVDGNGLTREDFDEDPDFAESYFRGDYDIACQQCAGKRVVAVIDRQRASKKEIAAYNAHVDSEAEYRAMCRAETRAERALEGDYSR